MIESFQFMVTEFLQRRSKFKEKKVTSECFALFFVVEPSISHVLYLNIQIAVSNLQHTNAWSPNQESTTPCIDIHQISPISLAFISRIQWKTFLNQRKTFAFIKICLFSHISVYYLLIKSKLSTMGWNLEPLMIKENALTVRLCMPPEINPFMYWHSPLFF